MQKNLYRILGITVGATAEEVKVAYRRRAKELHPDQSGLESGPFLEVREAYAILSDPEQRRSYDDKISGRQAHRGATAPGSPGNAEPFQSIGRVGGFSERSFSEFFTRFSGVRKNLRPFEPPPPQDLTVEVAISPQKARSGGTVHVRLPFQSVCPRCRGYGSAGGRVCWGCGGKGTLFGQVPLAFDLPGGVHDCAQIRIPLDPYGIPNCFANILLRIRGGGWDWF